MQSFRSRVDHRRKLAASSITSTPSTKSQNSTDQLPRRVMRRNRLRDPRSTILAPALDL
jgi:hypothetical protein